ncbi:MAG: hypothetical protein AB7S26_35285 [Sandaracinaceae bacterium]
MSGNDLQQVKQALVDAGLEIYRTTTDELEIAERVRLHIMDSGVRVRPDLSVVFIARSQRSDFPSVNADQLFAKVRDSIGPFAMDRGYAEEGSQTVDVRDPMDANRVLDVWHEVVYVKVADDVAGVVDEVRWALNLDRYVTPESA